MPKNWQGKCARSLEDAQKLGGAAGEAHWRACRQKWLTRKRDRVILHGLDLSGRDLRGYDFTRCWIGATNFEDANLSGSDFSQAIIRGCNLNRANLCRTTFWHADLADHPEYDPNSLLDVQFDSSTDIEVNRDQLPAKISRSLRDSANRAWRRSEWRMRRSRSWVYRFLTFTTDYGFGVGRLFLASAAIIGLFSVAFANLQKEGTTGDAVSNSTRYFLAIGDPYEKVQPALSYLGMLESISGFVALAMLITIFTNKFTDL